MASEINTSTTEKSFTLRKVATGWNSTVFCVMPATIFCTRLYYVSNFKDFNTLAPDLI